MRGKKQHGGRAEIKQKDGRGEERQRRAGRNRGETSGGEDRR